LRIDAQLKNEPLIDGRFLCPRRYHFLLTCLALRDEVTRDLPILVLNLFAWPPALGVVMIQPGSRFQTGSAEFLIAHAIRRQRRMTIAVFQVCILFESVDLWRCYLRTGRFTNVGEPPWISASAL
jgi:hypothetical protein